ncbi:cholesterol esterase [Streptomyces pimonensis]|uniref:Cholesterol esterase n=1 Tax=Streptomyces pimonensis TaxID=2860288 RepID=A0ABV4IVV8_9ACTN
MESQVRGGTRWKRFAVVMVPSVLATAAVGVGLAQGALAASFSVSGQQFKVTADYLKGDGFAQYGGVDTVYASTEGKEKKPVPVAISSFDTAEITKMCQSVATKVPLIGKTVYLRLEAGNNPKKPVTAENLYIDVAQLDADAKFEDIDIGVALQDKSRGPVNKDEKTTKPGGFAQQARVAHLYGVEQTAWATTAGTFTLNGLSMRLGMDPDMECY